LSDKFYKIGISNISLEGRPLKLIKELWIFSKRLEED